MATVSGLRRRRRNMLSSADRAPDPGDDPRTIASAISTAELERAVEALRGMGYEHRLHILILLRTGSATPKTLSESIGAHPTAVAHHLRQLADAALVRRRRDGRHIYYSLSDEAVGRLVDEVLRYVRG
ncbi:ArsR/SmtB family transcription factor [Micromonosporaceae bacterium Da 78-11]